LEPRSKAASINPLRIGFFFGAGASIEFGIPSMKQMTVNFARKIRGSAFRPSEKKLFNTIYGSLAKVYGVDNVDLETIMSVIVGLNEENHIKDNIGELGLFILEKNKITSFTKPNYDVVTLDRLENKFRKYVRDNTVIRNSKKIDLSRNTYYNFFKQICAITTCYNVTAEDSDPNKYTHDKWTFFTTNYDNVIEDFWVRSRRYSDLDLGFDQTDGKIVMNADKFLRNNTTDVHRKSAMQLVKLHGSVNWIKDKGGEIEEYGYHLSLDDVRSTRGSQDIEGDLLIYPLSQKQLYFTPFIQLFGILNAELSKRDFWIVIGYSYRDIIIRTMFEKALAENSKRKILLVHPYATEQIQPLFHNKVRDQITCLNRYFAKKNYEIVNKEISDRLLMMANE
jgi:hypothetical protein